MSAIRTASPLKMPIGISNFATLIQEGYTFADKTAMIAEVIENGAQVTLIARPRRFGKTLNLSMLHNFFAAEAYGTPTRGLFEGLAVAGDPATMAHQGRYPVIFFSFKDIKVESFPAFEESLRVQLAALMRQYPELPKSAALDTSSRETVQLLLAGKADLGRMANAFRLLSELLKAHHGQKVVILLDEYDTPIHSAYTHGFYQPLIGFMRNLFGAALKDNPYLFKAIVTGILRVSKESLFSDLNNIRVHTVLDDGYCEYFGFTEAEVGGLLRASGLPAGQPALESEIKAWYNGYRFGPEVIYNPWSIVNCLDRKGALQPYWVNTSGSALLKKLMAQAGTDFKDGLERLIKEEPVSETIDPNLVFGDPDGNTTALWSLLLFSGYLTALEVRSSDSQFECELAIPNQEIRSLYRTIIRSWFADRMGENGYRTFLRSLVSGNVAEFEARLRDYLFESASLFDAQGRHPEKFYHGLMLGLVVGLRNTHVIHSNRESGLGRYDVAIFPKPGASGTAPNEPGVILEFKQTPKADELQAAAAAALAQIDRRRYEAELRQHPVRKLLAIGIAFSGKEMALAHQMTAIDPQ